MRRQTLAATAVLWLLLLGGCGSSGSSTGSSQGHRGASAAVGAAEQATYVKDRRRFIAQAEQVCHAGIVQIEPLAARLGSLAKESLASQKQAAAAIREALPVYEADATKLEPLAEPSRDTEAVSTWLRAVHSEPAVIDEFAEQLELHGLAGAQKAYQAVIAARQHSHELAAAYGFTGYCSQFG